MGEPKITWNETPPRKLNQEHNFCDLKRLEGGVYILNFTGEIQHRFTPKAIRSIDESLDKVVRDASACALITTNQGKFFSNGMDVDYIRDCDRQVGTARTLFKSGVFANVSEACKQVVNLLSPNHSSYKVKGHAVGAGFIFAMAHDYRLMTSSRGYIFMNEVDLGMSLTPGNMAVLRSKLPISTFQEATLTGKRYDGGGAAAAAIVHATSPTGPTLLEEGINIAMEYKARNWKREVYYALKMEMFSTTVRELKNGGTGFARM